MTWHVQYRQGRTNHIVRLPTPAEAIEAACRLLDNGCDVYGIGTGPLTDSIKRDQIAGIYAQWVRARTPLGINSLETINSLGTLRQKTG